MPQTEIAWRLRRPPEGFYTSQVEAPGGMPVRTFLPVGYEPNYPYPLLVFFHGHGSNEEQALRLAPRLSRRNYVAIGLRGPRRVHGGRSERPGFAWTTDGECDIQTEDYVVRAIEQTRRNYHIHSERIYLAGICEGAGVAYRLGLTFPDKLAGVISLNGAMPGPGNGRPLFRLPELRRLRAFIGHGYANSVLPLTLARHDYQALYAAGCDVRLQTYPTTHRLHPDMLRDINRWVMEQVVGDDY
jgi:phospholipase/carboxylesterase